MAVEPRSNQISSQVDALLPTIRRRREEIERARRLPGDLAEALRATGVFTLSVPKAVGGRQAEPAEILRTIERVATVDGSTGWCTMIGITNNHAGGFMPKAGSQEVFANPTMPTAGIAAPSGSAVRVDGGVRVTGRWQFGSGITHSEWLWAGCMVMQDGKPVMTARGPEIIHVCMPVRDVEIHDTWFVSGLCGTGSNDFSARDVYVPERRIFALLDNSTHWPDALYQMPAIGWFVSQLVAVSLGIARGALDELIEMAQTKIPTLSTAVLADKPVVAIDLARAEVALAAARALLYDSVEDLWQMVTAGSTPTPRQVATNRIAAMHAAETGATVTRTASVLAGGSAIYAASAMQRHMRDAEAVTHHFTVAPQVWEDAGRIFLGRQPVTPVF